MQDLLQKIEQAKAKLASGAVLGESSLIPFGIEKVRIEKVETKKYSDGSIVTNWVFVNSTGKKAYIFGVDLQPSSARAEFANTNVLANLVAGFDVQMVQGGEHGIAFNVSAKEAYVEFYCRTELDQDGNEDSKYRVGKISMTPIEGEAREAIVSKEVKAKRLVEGATAPTTDTVAPVVTAPVATATDAPALMASATDAPTASAVAGMDPELLSLLG